MMHALRSAPRFWGGGQRPRKSALKRTNALKRTRQIVPCALSSMSFTSA